MVWREVDEPHAVFGDGSHPTTRLCLELLQEVEPTTLVDVGCGSGVLSIAAAKLGFAPVSALDLEEGLAFLDRGGESKAVRG